ncbi:DNA-binding transcriptional MerR regulator [Evansella vedderi]|uniref:DNA-binding transcriptional MerR regulator n=1 Tax=Evansella vedderi TaxID=38282 RepID=A0ABU0A1Z9_9BACI|nr:MerR family transcriptional regulator [Evansella vedderi]MDQ0257505.1 DNA-binding transcriptional MerR regulator [Evansella vedderi]
MEPMSISQLAEKLELHTNTVNNWFSLLDAKKIHLVNVKTVGKKKTKTYDEKDYNVALYIKGLRDEGILLEEIVENLQKNVSVRFHSVEDHDVVANNGDNSSINLHSFESILIENVVEEIETCQEGIRDILNGLDRLSQSTDIDSGDNTEFLIEKLTDLRIIELVLELEALDKWEKLHNTKFYWFNIFKKNEAIRKEKFVKNHVIDNMEEYVNRRL